MKVALFSNYLIHHQLPFCLSMREHLGNDFVFVASEPITQERLALGYVDMNHQYDFVLNAYDGEEEQTQALNIARTYDVIIFGSAPEHYFKERMTRNLLTFRYSERPLKNGRKQILRPKTLYTMLRVHTRYMTKKLYLMCASAYAYADFALSGAYWRRAFQWGYFPETRTYDEKELMRKKVSSGLTFLWAGRFLDWKHPDTAVYLAKRLKDQGLHFELQMIGRGEMEQSLRDLIRQMDLEDCVHLLGSMSPDNVRSYMEKSRFFLFTSDRHEGWGAVLNEAMNSGCVVFASSAIGSAPFLLKNGENGWIYPDGDEDVLYERVTACINDPEKIGSIGLNAYRTIVNCWNADEAAKRFLIVAQSIQEGKKPPYEDGPMSRARLI